MNEIEKLRTMYNNSQNLQEKQKIAETINDHIKRIEEQVIAMKTTIDTMNRNMSLLWEHRTLLHNILHKKEEMTPVVENSPIVQYQINMLKQSITPQIIPKEFECGQTLLKHTTNSEQHSTTNENISTLLRRDESLENPTRLDSVHTAIIVEIELPRKWLYSYKITILSKQIKKNRCIVKIDLDSVPQQHRHITEVSGVKKGYVDIYINDGVDGVDKIYNIRITSDISAVTREMISLIRPESIISQTLLIGILCGIRTCF
jgi:hypothetical protein